MLHESYVNAFDKLFKVSQAAVNANWQIPSHLVLG